MRKGKVICITSITDCVAAAEASDGQGAVSNKAIGSSSSAPTTGMLRKITTRRVKIKRPDSLIQEEDDDVQVQPKRTCVVSKKDPVSAKSKPSITAASMNEVQKMGTSMITKRGGGPSTSLAAAIQTKEVPMAALEKKLGSMSTTAKKDHLADLLAQVQRHDNRIQMLEHLITMEQKKRNEKLEQVRGVRAVLDTTMRRNKH